MRKYISLVLVLLLLCSVAHARVGASSIGVIKLQSTGLVENHTHVRTSPTKVYKITFRANTDDAFCALLDSNTTGSENSINTFLSNNAQLGKSIVKVDIGEATSGDWFIVDFGENPLIFEHGIFVAMGSIDALGTSVQQTAQDAQVIIHYSTQ